MHRRNELILVCTIPRDGIDHKRAFACEFVIGHHAVSVVVTDPGLFRILLYLDDDIDIVKPVDSDLLTQLHRDESGTHIDADDFPLLCLFVLKDIPIVVQRGPSLAIRRTELHTFLLVNLLELIFQWQ